MKPEAKPVPVQVLIVDDEPTIQKAWRWMLHSEEFESHITGSAQEALALLRNQKIDVVVSDVCMPGMDGLELLKLLKQERTELEVILMTGMGSISNAVEAIRAGAFDYLTKPLNQMEEWINTVRQAARVKRLREENEALRQQLNAHPNSPLLESKNLKMKALLTQLRRVARVDSNLLITGPTGVGKGIIAQQIHEQSPRRDRAFVSVDAGSIPLEMVESELFGQAEGTESSSHKIGLFESAHQGTIFLDEIGNMPISMQSSLLRVIEEQRLRPVGSSQEIKIDVRVISTTQMDLEEAIKAERFRSDLYFRLKVVELKIPPLSERLEDIPHLAYHFLKRNAPRIGREFKGIHPEAMEALQRYEWPGNVRELEHLIEAAMVFETGEELSLEHLPAEIKQKRQEPLHLSEIDLELPFREALEQADRRFRVSYLRGLMARFPSVSAAARHAQMDRANFRRLLRRYEVNKAP